MSKGFTDWDVPVNINAQQLGEIINRPKYGAVSILAYEQYVTTDTEKSLGIVSGKGMTYGGYLDIAASSDPLSSFVSVFVDGETIGGSTAALMMSRGLLRSNYSIPFLIYFDQLNNHYVLGFGYGITFESSMQVTIIRPSGVQLTISMYLYYALI